MSRVFKLSPLLLSSVLLVAGCSSSRSGTQTPANPSAVAVIDGEPLSLSAFEHEYARSSGSWDVAAADSMAAYEDFLERYVNYRIKVLEAKNAGLEADSSITAELNSYRTQYAKPYLISQKVIDPIVRDLYARSLEMVEASHILLRSSQNADPADTLEVYNKITAIRDSALAGVDFGDLAARHSEDPSAKNPASPLGYRGFLGFFTSGTMVPQFEDWAYKTPIGEISPVFRTRYGYHIIKVTDRKPTPNDIVISHIMITPAGKTPADSARALILADSLYNRIEQGDDFASLATVYSADKQSGAQGGRLGTIGYGSRLIPVLKEAAFGLTEVGSVTHPVLSPFGYHLIRLDDVVERPSFDEAYEDLKASATRSPRASAGEAAFADSVLAADGASIDSLAFFDILKGVSPDSVLNLIAADAVPNSEFVLATIGADTYRLGDVVRDIQWNRYRAMRNNSPQEVKALALRDYFRERAIDKEVAALEKRDKDFADTMQEFRNGILLFRLMEDSVWSAAAADSIALQKEYDRDPSRFTYPDRTRLVTYFSSTKAPLADVMKHLDDSSAEVADSVWAAVRIDTTYLAGPSNSIYDRGLGLDRGNHTGILAYNSGSIIIVNDGTDPARTKTFDESRAELINIVQTKLEDQLIDRLREKYSVRTFPANLKDAFAPSHRTE